MRMMKKKEENKIKDWYFFEYCDDKYKFMSYGLCLDSRTIKKLVTAEAFTVLETTLIFLNQ